MGVAGPVHASRWWCAPSWRSPRPAMRTARCRRIAWSPSSRTRAPCAPRRAAPRASSATRACGASTRTRSARSSKRSRPARDEIDTATRIIAAAAARRLGADQLRRQAAGPRELPLLLAGAGEGAPHRAAAARRSAGAGLPRRRPESNPRKRQHRMKHASRTRSPPPRCALPLAPPRAQPSRAAPSRRRPSRGRSRPASRRLTRTAAQGRRGSHADRRRPRHQADATPTWRWPSASTSATSRASSAPTSTVHADASSAGFFLVTHQGATASACTRWKAAPAPSAWRTRRAAPCGCSWATSRC